MFITRIYTHTPRIAPIVFLLIALSPLVCSLLSPPLYHNLSIKLCHDLPLSVGFHQFPSLCFFLIWLFTAVCSVIHTLLTDSARPPQYPVSHTRSFTC